MIEKAKALFLFMTSDEAGAEDAAKNLAATKGHVIPVAVAKHLTPEEDAELRQAFASRLVEAVERSNSVKAICSPKAIVGGAITGWVKACPHLALNMAQANAVNVLTPFHISAYRSSDYAVYPFLENVSLYHDGKLVECPLSVKILSSIIMEQVENV